MPNLTTPIPKKITGAAVEDLKEIQKWGTALIDELTYIFNNLDAGNVSEAASVKAENIDTNTAKIQNAQIGILTADKLKAGTVDTNLVTVSSESGNLNISGNSIVISDKNTDRFKAEYSPQTDIFSFVLCNKEGQPTVYINSLGNAVFSGKIDSSEIYSSKIIGTDSISYDEKTGDVFAEIDTRGIKVMQDKNNTRLQKIGMSVGDDGTAYMVSRRRRRERTDSNKRGRVFKWELFDTEELKLCIARHIGRKSGSVVYGGRRAVAQRQQGFDKRA